MRIVTIITLYQQIFREPITGGDSAYDFLRKLGSCMSSNLPPEVLMCGRPSEWLNVTF